MISPVDAVRGVIAAQVDALAHPDCTIYLGYSGGLDSTVLLHAARALYPQRTVALHANHGLHADAARWQDHCGRVCEQWGTRLISRAVQVVEGNQEAAARAARYAFFESVLEDGDLLLLAHHQDDQSETMLLRLVQGRGIFGMPERRPLGCGMLLRPLLELPRTTLRDYAAAEALAWVEDPSNADSALDRNYLRAQVMPALRARWPQVGAAVQSVLEQRRVVDELALAELGADSAGIAAADLLRHDEAAAVALLRIWLVRRGVHVPSMRALAEFVGQLAAPRDRAPVLALRRGSLRRYRDRVYYAPEPPALAASYQVVLPGTTKLPHGELVVEAVDAGGFAGSGRTRIVFPGGEEIPGSLRVRGHRRSLKKLFQQAGVPPWLRPGYPLLADEAGIACVPGIADRDDTDGSHRAKRWCARWKVR